MTPQHPPRVDHWPPALRSAATLTGTLVRCGPGFRPVSWPDNAAARCTAIGWLLEDRYAAIENTAAWVWGARRSPGTPLRLMTRRGRAPAWFESVSPDSSVHVSHFKLIPGDVVEIAGFGVTSRQRTAYDLLRSAVPLAGPRLVACRLLLLSEPGARRLVALRARSASRADHARIERRLRALPPPEPDPGACQRGACQQGRAEHTSGSAPRSAPRSAPGSAPGSAQGPAPSSAQGPAPSSSPSSAPSGTSS